MSVNAIVTSIAAGSPAAKLKIKPGDILRKINGHIISDVLDYKYYSYDERIMIELEDADGMSKVVRLRKPEGADIGLEFDTYLMDRERSCANKCVFCFIDQLPKGMRETLYYKDDDVRLSFFQGNYVTLTNLSERDVDRLIRLRVSPLNVSVHTLDPELRAQMLGRQLGGNGCGEPGLDHIRTLAGAGITMNCQIVCCPGINDGERLAQTFDGLLELGDCINSVSVVPVGLTKHREGLTRLQPFDKELALAAIGVADRYGEIFNARRGSRVVYCADELYIKAELELPLYEYYEDYPQLENGVGMMRLFISEFMNEFDRTMRTGLSNAVGMYRSFSVVTGCAASSFLSNLVETTVEKCDIITGSVYVIRNDFFGDGVTVSGLITGRDIISQLKGCVVGARVLIPVNMLRSGEEVFLDDVTVTELSRELGVPVRIVQQDGADFLRAVLGW